MAQALWADPGCRNAVDRAVRLCQDNDASRAIQKRIRKERTRWSGRATRSPWRDPDSGDDNGTLGSVFVTRHLSAFCSSDGITSFVVSFASMSEASERSRSVSAPALCVMMRSVTLL